MQKDRESKGDKNSKSNGNGVAIQKAGNNTREGMPILLIPHLLSLGLMGIDGCTVEET